MRNHLPKFASRFHIPFFVDARSNQSRDSSFRLCLDTFFFVKLLIIQIVDGKNDLNTSERIGKKEGRETSDGD